MINDQKFSIRTSIASDATYLKKWLMVPNILKWFPMCNELEIDDSIRIWLSYISQKATFTAVYDNKPCGMMVLYLHNYVKIAHQALFAIIVDEQYRGQGIGTKLMYHGMKEAKERFNIELLHLEVYEGNPVISLYERLGFKQYGLHKNFLKEAENQYLTKILMQKTL